MVWSKGFTLLLYILSSWFSFVSLMGRPICAFERASEHGLDIAGTAFKGLSPSAGIYL